MKNTYQEALYATAPSAPPIAQTEVYNSPEPSAPPISQADIYIQYPPPSTPIYQQPRPYQSLAPIQANPIIYSTPNFNHFHHKKHHRHSYNNDRCLCTII